MPAHPPTPTSELLTRGVAEVINRASLERKLRRPNPLRVKYGIDPTGRDIHLGHAVPLRKLRAWQDAGHQAVLIIGDYTARIGDPSGRDEQRRQLSPEAVRENAATYLDQLGTIINMRRAEIRYNSEWYERLSPAEFIELIGRTSVQQALAHETFRHRLDAGLPLSLTEIFYPTLQGYDSVMVKADVELGGLDQKFNLLAGRDVQARYHQDQQDVMLTPYLTGLDGKRKMSKSFKNYIAVQDPPNEMYGKAMSIPDKLIGEYFELATAVSLEELQQIKKDLRGRKAKARDLKARLAREIVALYYGAGPAEQAEWEFSEIFRHKRGPAEIPSAMIKRGRHQLLNLLVNHQLAASRSEARRLVEQGGVKIDRAVVTDWETEVSLSAPVTLQVGKRKFLRLEPR